MRWRLRRALFVGLASTAFACTSVPAASNLLLDKEKFDVLIGNVVVP